MRPVTHLVCILLVAFATVLAAGLTLDAGPLQAADTSVSTGDLASRLEALDDAAVKKAADEYREEIKSVRKEIETLEAELDPPAPKEGEEAKEPPSEERAAEIKAEIKTRNAHLETCAGLLMVAANELNARGLESGEYSQLAITIDPTLAASVTAITGLLDHWLTQGKNWAIEYGPGLVIKAILFIVILIVFRILANILGRITSKTLTVSRIKAPELLKNFFVNVVSKLTFFAGLLIALQTISVPIAPLLAGIGVMGFVVGFALQDTLANFAAGIMILLYRPYDVGDFVTAGGVTGKVAAMSLVSTTLFTPDNQLQIVPNGKIWGDVITNVTATPTRRVDLGVGISYSDDIDHAERVLTEVITSHPMVLKDPEPTIKLHKLGESSVDFVVRPWVKTVDYWTVYWDLTKQIKQRLDKEGISIPFPQRDIHMIPAPSEEKELVGSTKR